MGALWCCTARQKHSGGTWVVLCLWGTQLTAPTHTIFGKKTRLSLRPGEGYGTSTADTSGEVPGRSRPCSHLTALVTSLQCRAHLQPAPVTATKPEHGPTCPFLRPVHENASGRNSCCLGLCSAPGLPALSSLHRAACWFSWRDVCRELLRTAPHPPCSESQVYWKPTQIWILSSDLYKDRNLLLSASTWNHSKAPTAVTREAAVRSCQRQLPSQWVSKRACQAKLTAA